MLFEGMDLIRKALTEEQPFSWEGRYYNFRTVSVWPRPVQQPLPPTIMATRSDDTVRYAAENGMGLGVSFIPVELMEPIAEKYFNWCNEAGWQPAPDQVVFRGNIYISETDQQAQDWLHALPGGQPRPAIQLQRSVAQVVQAARSGEDFDLRRILAGSPQGDVVGRSLGLKLSGQSRYCSQQNEGIPRPLRRRGRGPVFPAAGPYSRRSDAGNRTVWQRGASPD